MSLAALLAIDVVAITVLVLGLYFPRHRRRDMVLALFGINIGVLAVTQALASDEISAGLGLGLFGVLSIIRLRSSEMDHVEVAYYFAALTLGLLGGFPVSPAWVSVALMGLIVAVFAVVDDDRLLGGYRHQVMTLDRAFPDERDARAHLATLLDGEVLEVRIRKVDLVLDTTSVEVRYRRTARQDQPVDALVRS